MCVAIMVVKLIKLDVNYCIPQLPTESPSIHAATQRALILWNGPNAINGLFTDFL